MRDEEGDSRRKKVKRGTHVPLSELGFKAKLYSGIETEYTRRRVKYKAARYSSIHTDMESKIARNASWQDSLLPSKQKHSRRRTSKHYHLFGASRRLSGKKYEQ